MGKSHSRKLSKPPTSDLKYKSFVRFALVGASGCGKSAFVNAVRGIDVDDERAASVEIVGKEHEPIEYTYPSNPDVSFCDLPGYDTSNYPDFATYWGKLELEKYDIFLVFLSNRVMDVDLKIIKKIKSMKKPFCLIRPKIDEDVECTMIKKKNQFNEEDLLLEIRNYVIKTTKHLSCVEEVIFLISNNHPYKWDFFRLIEAIMKLMPAPELNATNHLTEQYLADAKTYIKDKGVSGVDEFLSRNLARSKDVKIRFAITGNSGTGKSAFVNAIRGLKDDDDGAAEVGVVEKTKVPTEYKHPDNPMISFVDLPGIGTPSFPDLPTYCEKVNFDDYDTFLIFTASRFTQHDLELAEKVKSIGKSFFLIRTKIDEDCRSKTHSRSINESETLETIRKDCMENVKNIPNTKEIFLIGNYDRDKWDFDRLIEAISDALPVLQRECLTLSLTNVTCECLKRKAKLLRAQAVAVATISAGTGAIPVSGVGVAIDYVLIKGTIVMFVRQLGLSDIKSEDLASLDTKYTEIIKRYKSVASDKKTVKTTVTKAMGVLMGIEEVSKYIPLVGLFIAGSIAFALTLRYLLRVVNELEETAIAVWDNAAKRSIQNSKEK